MKNGIAVALLFVGLISVILGIVCFSMENGAKEFYYSYGGDAYTGMQQAAAQGANNGYYGNNIMCLGFGSVLMVAGMVIMLLAINSILKNEFGGGSAKAGDSASGGNSTDSGSDYACSENADGTLCIKKYYGETSDLCIPEKIRGKAVTALGSSSFSGCGFLTSVVIPKGVVSIGDESFLGCKSLADLTIPDSVTDIRTGAFRGCRSLTAVTIPDSVTEIGANPFSYCSKLAVINVSPAHPALEVMDGVLFEKTSKRLVTYPCAFTAAEYSIPQGIEEIGGYAFAYCGSLTAVTIPDSVTTIGYRAFFDCESLTAVTIPDSVTTIGGGAFAGCPNLTLTITRDSYAEQYCKDKGIAYQYADANDLLLN